MLVRQYALVSVGLVHTSMLFSLRVCWEAFVANLAHVRQSCVAGKVRMRYTHMLPQVLAFRKKHIALLAWVKSTDTAHYSCCVGCWDTLRAITGMTRDCVSVQVLMCPKTLAAAWVTACKGFL